MNGPALNVPAPELTAAKNRLDEDGFCVMRGMVSAKTMRDIGSEVTDLLVRSGYSDGVPTSRGQPRYISSAHHGERPEACLTNISRSERLESVFQSDDFRSEVTVLSGLDRAEDIFVHPTKYIRAVPPIESESYFPAGVHQDYPELQGSVRQLTVWAPIFPVCAESGTLPIYRQPERRILPMALSDNPSGWAVDDRYLAEPSIPELLPGDALVFSTFTPHGGSRNLGTGWRVSVECRVQPLADPIAECNLRPNAAATWEDHYLGWRKHGFYWYDRHPIAIPSDCTWERWRDLTAISEGRRGNLAAYAGLVIACEFGKSDVIRDEARSILTEWEDNGLI